MIIDACMVRDELDLLEARLVEYEPFVDLFVVIEGDRQFGDGADKPYHVTDNADRFAQWAHKLEIIQHHVTASSPWEREHEQRRALCRELEHCDGNDVVAWGDVDEFWPVTALHRERTAPGVVVNRHMVFAPNLEHPKQEWGSIVARARDIPHPDRARSTRNHNRRIPGGFHFSWMPTDLTAKAKSTSHTEAAHHDYDRARRERVTPWDGQRLSVVDVDDTWPIWFRDGSCPEGWWA